MDRYLVSGALALLILQIAFLLNSLGLMGSWLPGDVVRVDSRQVIGRMLRKRESVKRKSADSIIWEDSEAQDTLYRYDSVLTLDHSAAELLLENDVRLQVQENTLVVLEPVENTASSDALRVRFQRGLMRSRNAGQRFLVGTGGWSVDAAPGSDLSLRALEGGDVQLEVDDGEVHLVNTTSGETAHFQEGKKLTLGKDKVMGVQTLSEDLHITQPQTARVYSHQFPVAVPVQWQGDAQWLNVGRLNHVEQKIPLGDGPALLSLEAGTYTLTLESDDGVISASKVFEVAPAPKLRYLNPLPRDRVAVEGETMFSWYTLEGVKQYEIRFTPDDADARESAQPAHTTVAPFALVHPAGPGAYSWSVFAYDLDGTVIPPFYSLPVYFTPQPLQAPKLRAPASSGEAPSQKTHRPKTGAQLDPLKKWQHVARALWHLVMPPAYAAEDKAAALNTTAPPAATAAAAVAAAPSPAPSSRQITFSWFPVEGADFYVIEISSKSDFLHPEVIQKVKTEEFDWTGFQDQVYYWRVAAGSNNGRMGVFSDPSEFDIKKLKTMDLKDLAPGLRYMEAKPTPTPKPATEKPPEKPPEKPVAEKKAEPVVAAPRAPLPPTKIEVQANLDYWVMSQKAEDVDKIAFKGLALPSVVVAKTWNWGHHSYMTTLSWQQLRWKPESESELPYQDDFTTDLYKFKIYQIVEDGVSWGLVAKTLPLFKRVGLEAVEPEDATLFGLLAGWTTPLSPDISWRSQVSLSYGDAVLSPAWENELRSYIDGSDGLFFGGLFDVSSAFGNDNQQAMWLRLGFEVGYDW